MKVQSLGSDMVMRADASLRRKRGGGAAALTAILATILAIAALRTVAGLGEASAQDAMSPTGLHLLMVEEAGCRFCMQWHAEIGPGYPRTDEGRSAPLKRVLRTAHDLAGLAPVVFTPTFILMRSGQELGRITGYPGADYFYPELTPLIAAAGGFPDTEKAERVKLEQKEPAL